MPGPFTVVTFVDADGDGSRSRSSASATMQDAITEANGILTKAIWEVSSAATMPVTVPLGREPTSGRPGVMPGTSSVQHPGGGVCSPGGQTELGVRPLLGARCETRDRGASSKRLRRRPRRRGHPPSRPGRARRSPRVTIAAALKARSRARIYSRWTGAILRACAPATRKGGKALPLT